MLNEGNSVTLEVFLDYSYNSVILCVYVWQACYCPNLLLSWSMKQRLHAKIFQRSQWRAWNTILFWKKFQRGWNHRNFGWKFWLVFKLDEFWTWNVYKIWPNFAQIQMLRCNLSKFKYLQIFLNESWKIRGERNQRNCFPCKYATDSPPATPRYALFYTPPRALVSCQLSLRAARREGYVWPKRFAAGSKIACMWLGLGPTQLAQ